MIYLKTDEEIELLRESNLLVAKTLGVLASRIKPGVTTLELDKIAEEYIRDNVKQVIIEQSEYVDSLNLTIAIGIGMYNSVYK